MPAFTAAAPGKIILFGEHAVVYGQPAVAVPVHQVCARATLQAEPRKAAGDIRILAPAIHLDSTLQDLPCDDPLVIAIQSVQETLHIAQLPAFTLRIQSTIPVASGLGSGAAVSVALIRALSAFLGQPLPDDTVNALAYTVEKRHHLNPSGVDNTVITYAKPIYFVRGQPLELLNVAEPLTFVIGDSGIQSRTADVVAGVRSRWQADPAAYEALFARIGQLTRQARAQIETGSPTHLGEWMDENHHCLQAMGVSCPELNRLVLAARAAGAQGAKLSGGGLGGNMIALCAPTAAETVATALQQAGAVHTTITHLPSTRME